MNNQNIEDKALTTLAFVIGLALIDNLSSTEQNAVGNWIMLIAQTLCTNGSYTFNKEWKGHINNGNTPVTKDTLEKVGDIIKSGVKKFTDFSKECAIPLTEILENVGQRDVNTQIIMESFDLSKDDLIGFNETGDHIKIKCDNNVIYSKISPECVREVNDFYNSFDL